MSWTDERGPHRISLNTESRVVAETLAREFWSRRQIANAGLVGDIVAAWLEATPTAAGSKRNREAWKAAASFWGSIHPASIDAELCRAYIEQRKRAINTVRNELSMLRSAFKWAKGKSLVAVVPKFWLPAMPDSEVGHLSKEMFRKFLGGCRAVHVVLFVQLAVLTGGRLTALLDLQWDQVDLERRLIYLNALTRQQTPNKRRATVPISDRLHALLTEAREGALTAFVIEYKSGRVHSLKTAFAAASARSGIRCTPHMLRHSAAVWMAEDRVPMVEIAAFLGHRDTRITERVYARFHPDYLQRAVRALDW